MKPACLFAALVIIFSSCQSDQKMEEKTKESGFSKLMQDYYDQQMKLSPLTATLNGEAGYNDLLSIDFTDGHRDSVKTFINTYLAELAKVDTSQLSAEDRLSYDVLKFDLEAGLEALNLGMAMDLGIIRYSNYIPLDQFYGLHLSIGQMGSGGSLQPFRTVRDYEDWEKRAKAFRTWADSAIIYFRKGMATNKVLPKSLVVKIIPQLKAMIVSNPEKSLFFKPVQNFPADFSDADKQRLTSEYRQMISRQLMPAFTRLHDFLQKEYLPKASGASGINSLPNGSELYKFMVKYWTTTDQTPDEIYKTGLREVKRISEEMEAVKKSVGFKGNMKAFFAHMSSNPKFTPYDSAAQVLGAFEDIHKKIEPNVKKLFKKTPKTPFEIRRTEAFREKTASAEYFAGLPDGSRPGIFYVPIINAKKFNITSGMESLFLHEAIPGHHFQISLQNENQDLPKFRRFNSYGAYTEGYALYCESLGKELGLYTDPYQHMGALGDEMHRAIRLVVDVALHTGKMSREEAIRYMMSHESIDEQGAVAEIERYMAMPAQALSYKTGAIKIQQLRKKYQDQLGDRFNIGDFHDALLKDGALPLTVLEKKMDVWANNVK